MGPVPPGSGLLGIRPKFADQFSVFAIRENENQPDGIHTPSY